MNLIPRSRQNNLIWLKLGNSIYTTTANNTGMGLEKALTSRVLWVYLQHPPWVTLH